MPGEFTLESVKNESTHHKEPIPPNKLGILSFLKINYTQAVFWITAQ